MMSTHPLRPLALIAVIVVIAAAAYLMLKPGADTATIGEHETDTPVIQNFDSALYGIHFSFPNTYVLTEHEAGTGERMHHVITLIDKVAAANIPENGEGPTAITIDVFGNGIDKESVEHWIKNNAPSNFKRSADQALSTTTVSGVSGFSYMWDGLYRGESTVVSHKDNILMFSVTSMDSTDRIRDDFRTLLSSVRLR